MYLYLCVTGELSQITNPMMTIRWNEIEDEREKKNKGNFHDDNNDGEKEGKEKIEENEIVKIKLFSWRRKKGGNFRNK